MLYLFHGDDPSAVRSKAFAWVTAARAKAPEAPYVRLLPGMLTKGSLAEALGAQGLFYAKSLVLLDDPFSESDSADLILESLAELAATDNVIAILAPKLLATRVKKIEPHTVKVFESKLTTKKPVRGFNSALVNALAAKDGPVLWKEIVKAVRQGDAPEAVHGLLHWKARDMMQKGARAWSPEEARMLSRRLIELVSEARSGELPLGISLERFALSLR